MDKTTDRRYADRLHREAGWALKRCASQQNQLALALGQDESWISRQCNGIPGRIQRAGEFVARLARARKTSPGPILTYLAEVARDSYGELDLQELQVRLERALDIETPAQADEDLAEYELIRALRDEDPQALARALEAYIRVSQIEIDWQTDAVCMAKALLREIS